nr:MAG TPA: hypothetical protein [Caudoviricetes sp.]
MQMKMWMAGEVTNKNIYALIELSPLRWAFYFLWLLGSLPNPIAITH